MISDLFNSGGTQRVLTTIANLLSDEYDVFIIPNRDGVPFFDLCPSVKVRCLSNQKDGLFRRAILLYKFLRDFKIDYYINMDSNAFLFNSFLTPLRTKVVLWEHFSLDRKSRSWKSAVSRFYTAFRTHNIVTLSAHERELWCTHYRIPKNKVLVINNPVSIKPTAADGGTNYECRTFLAVGNDLYVKGFDILVEAFSKLKVNWKLQIVGLSTSQQQMIKKQALSLGIELELHGPVKNIEEFYKRASALVLSSRFEATPLVLSESQAFGLPSVVFNHLPSVLEMAGDAALIADFCVGADSLAERMEELARDFQLYSSLTKSARANIQKFTVYEVERRWHELLS